MTAAAVATAAPTGARPGRAAALAVLCMAQFMLIVDVVVVNVALPSIRADLALPDSRLQLVAVGYTLTFGSLLIVFGRAGDLFGRRRLFLVGLAVFTLASLATGLAAAEWQLVAARAAQGVGAAMVSPTALALLMAAFDEGEARNRALGYWGAVGSGGAIAGQLLGGVLTEAFGWRSVFLVNVPVGAVGLLLALRFLDESRTRQHTPLDVRGAALLAGGLAAVILALTQVGEAARGGAAAPALATGAVGVILLAGFAAVECRHRAPLVDRSLLRTGHVARGNALLAVNAGMLGGALFFTTLYLQVVLGYSPLAVGAAFAPVTLLILLLSPRVGARVAQAGVRRLLTIGFSLSAVGMAVLARMPGDGAYATDVLPALVLLAVGSACSYAPTFVAATTGVPDDKQGMASGLLNASQELGAAVGVTALATLAAAVTADVLVVGYRAGLAAAAAVTALALIPIRRLPALRFSTAPPAVENRSGALGEGVSRP